jgi:UDP:flavonoid glycosyltransferase YjiC (YdhE family)
MKVMFIPWGQAPHYFSMVPLVWAFRAAGDEVRIASQPGAADAIKRSGMSVTVVGNSRSGVKKILGDGRPDYIAQLRKRFLERQAAPYIKAAQVMADDVVQLARAWQPDLVISDPIALAAPLAARAARAPLVHLQWGPAVQRLNGELGASPDLTDDLRDLCDLYTQHGVELTAEHAVATVDPCPASLQYQGVIPSRIPARFVPYNGTGDAPRWLTEPPRRPRICVTWGTITTTMAGREGFLVPRILDALAAFDVEVVVTLTAADRPLLGNDLPERVRVAENLPLHLLLPSCDAIIHQGGASTMLTAASFGLPQLIVAGILDQLANAERIATAGAGVSLQWADASHETITAGIKTIVSDQATRQAARDLRDENHAQPAPAAIAATLRQLTTGHLTTTQPAT